MSAASLGATYSPPSPLELHYSDDIPSVYHADRPIRPLPKRRLRSRLSSEAANSILTPASLAPKTSLFPVPLKDTPNQVNGHGAPPEDGAAFTQGSGSQGGMENGSYQFKGNEVGSDDEENAGIVRRYHEQRQRPPSGGTGSSRNGYIVPRNDSSKYTKPPISHSTLSSGDAVDGYDSFENTNNKKKRKIPALGGHHSTLSAEMASMGLSSTRDIDVSQVDQDGGVGHYYGTGSSATPAKSSGTGISGAGRGRYGRAGGRRHSGRSPLGVSSNGLNYSPRRDYAGPGLTRKDPAATRASDQGIISAAIANAAAIPATPLDGKENISLLEQQSLKKPSSAKTQFTFTCESDSAKSMMWPGYGFPSPNASQQASHPNVSGVQAGQNSKGFSTQGTQTSPEMAGQASQANSQHPGSNQQAPQQPKKPRRPLVKQYAMAAKERRLRQNYNNYNHPPKEEDVWVCEFCEYESIFGSPPEALIRQYEIKDRRERRRLAEKRRLLEKAKMKGRKGKKGKNAGKNTNATQAQQGNEKQRYDQQPLDEASIDNQGTQSEDYMLDEYDDDPTPMPALSAQTPSKIPQPVAQNQKHSLRPPSGSGGRTAGSAGSAA